jgi:hypothetical protein
MMLCFPSSVNTKKPEKSPPVFRFFVLLLRHNVQGEMFPSHPVRIKIRGSGDTLDGNFPILCLQILTSGSV